MHLTIFFKWLSYRIFGSKYDFDELCAHEKHNFVEQNKITYTLLGQI